MWTNDSIRALRASKKLSQKALATVLGTSQQMISEWELGIHVPRNAYQTLLTLKFGKPGVRNEESKESKSGQEGSKVSGREEAGSEKEG